MFARFCHETGLGEDAGHLETEAPQGAPGAGSQGPPSTLVAPVLEQWDLPQNIKTALSNALELDGSELVDDVKAIPPETLNKVLSEQLFEGDSGPRLSSPIIPLSATNSAVTHFGSPFPRLPREADARSVQP